MGNPKYIPVEVSFLAVYAASKDDGSIYYIKSLSGTSMIAGGYDFTPSKTVREVARWKEALDTLVTWKWVTPIGAKGEVFQLTNTGYKWADIMKDDMSINTDNSPLDEIKGFE